jgi:hypothetical protein
MLQLAQPVIVNKDANCLPNICIYIDRVAGNTGQLSDIVQLTYPVTIMYL